MVFCHATFFFPAKSTWQQAIQQDYLQGCPRLMADCAMKYIQGTETTTAKGHLNQTWQGTWSTMMDDHPILEPDNTTRNHMFIAMADIAGKIYTDQTGRFPVQTSHGNKYVVIVYIYDANAILSYFIKKRSTGELLHVFHQVYAKLHAAGNKPQLHKLDTILSTALEMFIASNNAALQCTPPEMHQTNAAKHAVQMWNCHFKVGLASLPKQFPIAHWCHLTAQCDISLNMLYPSCQKPKLSTKEALHGAFHFDATPMSPPGTKCCVHVK